MPAPEAGLADSKAPRTALTRFWDGLHVLEDSLLVALLLVMILLAVAQIVLRNGFDASIVWADPFLRIAVLWVGLLGATIAARDNSHIAIDIATRYLPEQLARLSGVILSLFASGICGLLAWHAFLFVRDERAGGALAFAGVPAWLCEIILPLAFGLIAVRYLLIAVGMATGRRPVRADGV